jgi:enamine deaminase RidA (YjgF/YER057c/UK114 family)
MTDTGLATVHVNDLSDVPAMNEVYKQRMPDPKPAQVFVQVAGLIGGAKIEISAIVVKHRVITLQPWPAVSNPAQPKKWRFAGSS